MKSPKLAKSSQKTWYPYYAGYSVDFVDEIVKNEFSNTDSIIDPWNGSGTTSLVALQNHKHAVGYDINPAMSIIARARLAPKMKFEALEDLIDRVLQYASAINLEIAIDDMLLDWLKPRTASLVRKIEKAINIYLDCGETNFERGNIRRHDDMPLFKALLYCGLFSTVKQILAAFKTTNPMWHAVPSTTAELILVSSAELSNKFKDAVLRLNDKLVVDVNILESVAYTIKTESASSIPLATGSVCGSISSPPYATRLDYVKGTLPELAVLGVPKAEIVHLRQKMIGTTILTHDYSTNNIRSAYARQLVDKIAQHRTKGSMSYYAPWIKQYLLGLERGLAEIARVVKKGGPIAVVIQDSYYKELIMNLQHAVIEIMESNNRGLIRRTDYEVKQLRSRMNPNAKNHIAVRNNTESLLIFK
ncbi:MAG: hypothetical protein HY962_16860 [Ignavibacteriae bacterium]|nr:hypothetical protein [Ignavibacteriota bacterium]